jgi:hypothetical protein
VETKVSQKAFKRLHSRSCNRFCARHRGGTNGHTITGCAGQSLVALLL